MPEEEEYELTPHKQLEDLKKEIDRLKRNPMAGTRSSKDLLEAIDKLTEKIDDLIQLFKTAEEEMEPAREIGEETRKLNEKIDKLADENRKIAESMVSIAELVKKSTARPAESTIPEYHSAPRPLRAPPRVSPPPFVPPRTGAGSPTMPSPIPPPRPPTAEEEPFSERKGLFDKFKK